MLDEYYSSTMFSYDKEEHFWPWHDWKFMGKREPRSISQQCGRCEKQAKCFQTNFAYIQRQLTILRLDPTDDYILRACQSCIDEIKLMIKELMPAVNLKVLQLYSWLDIPWDIMRLIAYLSFDQPIHDVESR